MLTKKEIEAFKKQLDNIEKMDGYEGFKLTIRNLGKK